MHHSCTLRDFGKGLFHIQSTWLVLLDKLQNSSSNWHCHDMWWQPCCCIQGTHTICHELSALPDVCGGRNSQTVDSSNRPSLEVCDILEDSIQNCLCLDYVFPLYLLKFTFLQEYLEKFTDKLSEAGPFSCFLSQECLDERPPCHLRLYCL